MQEESRTALGLHLEGAVLILDEAHNLAEQLTGAHSCSLTTHQLSTAIG